MKDEKQLVLEETRRLINNLPMRIPKDGRNLFYHILNGMLDDDEHGIFIVCHTDGSRTISTKSIVMNESLEIEFNDWSGTHSDLRLYEVIGTKIIQAPFGEYVEKDQCYDMLFGPESESIHLRRECRRLDNIIVELRADLKEWRDINSLGDKDK